MASDSEPLALLGRTLDQLEALLGRIRPEQATLPTPCRSWTVGQLAAHLVIDLDNFAIAVRGGKPEWGRAPQPRELDGGHAFTAARKQLDATWASADLGSQVPTMTGGTAPLVSMADQEIAEFAVHGWDLARATGQDQDLDAGVARVRTELGEAEPRSTVPRSRGPGKDVRPRGRRARGRSDLRAARRVVRTRSQAMSSFCADCRVEQSVLYCLHGATDSAS